MKKLFYLLFFLLSSRLLAQTNYVVNTPNSAGPGTYNTLVGPSAGNATMTGNLNTFMGFSAGVNNTTGAQNTFIGMIAGSSNTTGGGNAFVGAGAGQNNTTGNDNAFIGAYAGSSNTTGFANAFLGPQAGSSNTTGYSNAYLGADAGKRNTTGYNNAFMGYAAGLSNTIGIANVFVGSTAGLANTTGNGNSFIGNAAGTANTMGYGNAFVGNVTGVANTTGYNNAFFGYSAGYSNSTGYYNTFVGAGAGEYNTTGYNNVFVGYRAGVSSAATVVNNAVAIGAYAMVSQSNSIVLGGVGANTLNVGIGNTAPQNRLEITQGTVNQSGLRFTNLISSSPASVLNQTKFLTVNASGDVVLGSINGSARVGADADGLWQATGDNLQNTNAGGVVIGPGVSKTPAGYRLYVADGVLTEKVKVAVKTTNDWSDRVFEKGYQLRSLGEVERYINQEKHLPGVPSAEQVVREGIDVGKMEAKLLEKIEEMTLYMIDIRKEVNALRQENQSLRQALKTSHQKKGK